MDLEQRIANIEARLGITPPKGLKGKLVAAILAMRWA